MPLRLRQSDGRCRLGTTGRTYAVLRLRSRGGQQKADPLTSAPLVAANIRATHVPAGSIYRTTMEAWPENGVRPNFQLRAF
jgi:hypothetical protein